MTSDNLSPPETEEQVDSDVMDLLLLSCSNGLGALISALAENGLLLPKQIEAIHKVMAPPLDHDELWDNADLAFLRENWDEELGRARQVAQTRMDEDLNDDV